ncbi:1,2-phenylacetyl-CoA epoxidase subunit PaaD [Streptomyces sp. NBC_01210]|uniref:1,2-phenylacetyl-CoA epoxidase subunit PaaD n=1 Tax=Streptomyces sp. NBC_01210 TaxID=2903774 RepID=UPI002E0E46A9
MPVDEVRARVNSVADPELPMLTLGDLGVIRAVETAADGILEVVVTPTYMGCPAMATIEADIRTALAQCGHPGGRVRQVLTPAWTTDWISPEGRRRLSEQGIAPPGPARAPLLLRLGSGLPCPNCGSTSTRSQSPFGATRCQAVLVCTTCQETFAHVKAL